MRRVRFSFEGVTLDATLRDTPTADAIHAVLPVEASVNTWGEEVYFAVPASCTAEADARNVVNAGEIAYWPAGKVIAIGFGRTPASTDGEIRLADEVNIWADAVADVRVLKAVAAGSRVRITAI
ncbi:cyclophilin-like fold protein [Afifella pfennigii]|uniref:cyclophilin-like fold protein n=1 Tax=Afifella pfennigii TaxID=209897 RepID=UPI00047BCE79|nr:cyclophilin-like fold protein [Afifella pfennigii]